MFTVAIAFLLGFVLQRASLCTVANMDRWITKGRADGMLGLAAATCSAGVVVLGLSWAMPELVALPASLPVTPLIALGGLLLGAGSLVNGSCYIGSIVRISSGNLNYLATLIGLGLAARGTWLWSSGDQGPGAATAAHAAPLWPAFWLAFAAVASVTLLGAFGRAGVAQLTLRGRWPRGLALVATGLAGGAVFGGQPGWSYSIITSNAYAGKALPAALLGAVALFAGAVLSARLAGGFHLSGLTVPHVARCLLGGTIMGIGAGLVPGGNDSLLLWTMPGLALHGLVAYAGMLLAIGMPMLLVRRRVSKA
jgi:hypothetical protein